MSRSNKRVACSSRCRWPAAMRYCAAALALAFVPPTAQAEIRIGLAAPLTGPRAWAGEETRAGVEAAVEDINGQGGVLGQPLLAIPVDDFCDPDQAVAAARKLVADTVPFVVGHQCSGAALPASEIYEEARILFISPKATNPRLTDRGLRYTFRTCGRDDRQGTMIGDHIAKKWPDADIAIVHDGQAYGQGVADEVKRRLEAHGIEPALFEQAKPGQTSFAHLVSAFERHGIDVAFYGGYSAEAGLIVQQTTARIPDLAFVVPDGVAHEDFWLIAGPAAEGTRMTYLTNPVGSPAAAELVTRLRAGGTEPAGAELYAYAAIQVWAQAAEVAGATDADQVARVLRAQHFRTVLGEIGFDNKGDVIGFEPFAWYVWTDGKFVLTEVVE